MPPDREDLTALSCCPGAAQAHLLHPAIHGLVHEPAIVSAVAQVTTCSRRREFCHSAAPPSACVMTGRCFNRDKKGGAIKITVSPTANTQVLGPTVLCWGVSLFSKRAGDAAYVGWHIDSYFWGLSSSKVGGGGELLACTGGCCVRMWAPARAPVRVHCVLPSAAALCDVPAAPCRHSRARPCMDGRVCLLQLPRQFSRRQPV